jgi:hypothetical protein
MGSFSDYVENKILNYVFNFLPFTFATGYVALSSGDPGEAGTNLLEVVGGSYARPLATGIWTSSTTGAIMNSAAIVFPTATANWGNITHFALFDHVTTGNMLGYGTLGTSKNVTTNDVVQFATGALTIRLD